MKRFIFLLLLITTSVAKPPELSNFGNTCYMNALLQALYNMVSLTDFLIINKASFEHDILSKNYISLISTIRNPAAKVKTIEQKLRTFYHVVDTYMELENLVTSWYQIKNTSKSKDDMIQKIDKEIENIDQDLKKTTDANKKLFLIKQKELLNNAKKQLSEGVAPQQVFNKTLKEITKLRQPSYRQNDAAVFLTKLLGQLTDEQQVAASAISSIYQLLSPTFLSTVVCPKPIYISDTKVEPALVIPVEVIKYDGTLLKTLAACLSNFFAGEILEEYKAEGVQFDNCSKQFKLQTASPYLIIQLKRFASEPIRKLYHDIDIPFVLDFKSIPDAGIVEKYNLISVVMHGGDVGGGHYTAYVNDQFESPSNWYFCDDETIYGPQVLPFTQPRHPREDAYILFYQRADYQPKKTVPTKEISTQLSQLENNLVVLQQALAA